VSTGIDMALAMVEQDLGRAVADRVASRSPLRRSFFSILPP
jgi:transcriptional regulator GlxA family with amidase domain